MVEVVAEEVEFSLLGPLAVRRAGTAVAIPAGKQRALLATLLLNASRVVPVDELIEALWDASPPASARASLHNYVKRLRKVLGDAGHRRISTCPHGYMISIEPGSLDVNRFEAQVGTARAAVRAGSWDAAAAQLRDALALRRGQPLADVDSAVLALREAPRLEELLLQALEVRIDADLHLGRHAEVISELRFLARTHPLRERPHAQLMLALYRDGRQAEALAAYQEVRTALVGELGIDPGPELRQLHQRILNTDPSLAGVPARGATGEDGPPGGPGPPRRGVTEAGWAWPPAGKAAVRGVFVGRADELAVLEAAAVGANRGEPRVVLVEGEAGIGKSSLLERFLSGPAGATVLRASGDEAEALLPYGIVDQLVASAQGNGGGPSGLLASDLSDVVDPLAVGADLVVWLGQVCRGRRTVLAAIDDLQWADELSARALLFAVRRLQADRVVVVVSARAGQMAQLGEGWQRFLAGDHRVSRVRLGGLSRGDVVELGQALGVGELPRHIVGRLLDETSGNPLYCRAVLEEDGAVDRLSEALWVPRSLADVVLGRVGALSPEARELVTAAALGRQFGLAVAARLANLEDPAAALEEAAAAGILVEQPGRAGAGVRFAHLLVQRVIYAQISLARRRELHQRAALLVDHHEALRHRVAAATGPEEGLAAQLEAAGREARDLGRLAQAAAWLAQAATASSEPDAADRRLLEALEILVSYGEVAEAEVLAARIGTASPSARCSWLLGTLDFLAGRGAAAEARLVEAWRSHDPARDASVGCAAATRLAVLCLLSGRIGEAVTWGERAAAAAVSASARYAAVGVLAIALFYTGRGSEGLARLAFLPAAPAEVPQVDTDTLVLRGVARVLAEDLADGIADLSSAAARLRAGVPLRTASACLGYLARAEYHIGSWDDAVMHAELAVSLDDDAGRVRDLGHAHSLAAVIPALRGDWEVASAHVGKAIEVAQAVGDDAAMGAARAAQQLLAMTQGDLEGAAAAAAAVRATGKKEFFSLAVSYDWRCLEIEALIGLGHLGQAATALAGMERDLSLIGPPSAVMTAARLRADLAAAAGHQAAAAAGFGIAWRCAQGLPGPLALAQLEISDGRRLRAAGQRQAAVARLNSARRRLVKLGARPYLRICDGELAAADAAPEPAAVPAQAGLTPTEQAVARLVATGRSNRQAATELYVSVKTVEFHLSNVFAKLGIRSRKDLHPSGAARVQP